MYKQGDTHTHYCPVCRKAYFCDCDGQCVETVTYMCPFCEHNMKMMVKS